MNESMELFSMRTFDFGGLQAGTSEEVVLVKHLDVVPFTEGRLNVRIHERTITHASSKIEVILKVSSPSIEQPEEDFVLGTALDSVVVVTGSAPALESEELPSDFAGVLEIVVKGTQGSAGTACNALLSAELIGKTPLEEPRGRTIELLSERAFDFSALAAGTTQTEILLRDIDVRDYRSAVLVVRVHSRSVATGASLAFDLYNTYPSVEDPELEFLDDRGSAATATISAGTTLELQTADLGSGFGPFLRLSVTATQTSPANDVEATVSVALVVRE